MLIATKCPACGQWYQGLHTCEPERPCCENICEAPGEKHLTGDMLYEIILSTETLGEPSAQKQAARAIKVMLAACRKPTPVGYVKEPGKVAVAMSEAAAQLTSENNVGVALYTYLGYSWCVKKNCGGIKALFKKCAPYHWQPRVSPPRRCTPTASERHWADEKAFLDRETAEAAVSRCQEEHIAEFLE